MPTSLITTLTPTFSSETAHDKMMACVSLMETEIPKIYYRHLTGAKSWFLYKQWRVDNDVNSSGGFGNHLNWPYNNAAYCEMIRLGSVNIGGHIGWFKFVNDFAALEMGLIYCANYGSLVVAPGYVSKTLTPSTDYDTVRLYVPNQGTILNEFHTIIGTNNSSQSNNIAKLNDFKLYVYSSDDFAYIGFMNMDRCVIATKAHYIDDPTKIISVLVISCINNDNDLATDMMFANTIDILMQGSRVPISYNNSTTTIPQSTSFSKLVLHKFVQSGYYFDNIFTYSGTLPSNHFMYNGAEYVKIACNLLIKIG